MSFNVQVRLDTSQVAPAIQQTATGLGEVETKVDSVNTKFKGWGETLKTIGGAAGVLAAAHELGDAIRQIEDLQDQYTELSNRALKFVDDAHSLNAVLAQQAQLATDLHTTMAKTIDLYDAVGDALDELNLSQGEQTRLTQTLGEAAIVAGKPLDTASTIISRLAVAMEAGTGAGKAMQTIIRQFPELADQWSAALDTNRSGLVRMAADGELSLQKIVDLSTSGTAKLDALANSRTKTYEAERATIQENFTVFRQSMSDQQAMFEAVSPALRAYDEQMRDLSDPTRAAARQQDLFNAAVSDGLSRMQNFIQNAFSAGRKTAEEYTASINAATKKLDDLKAAYDAGAVSAEYYRHTQEALLQTINGHVPIVTAYGNAMDEAREKLAELNQAHADGAVGEEYFRKQQEQLLQTLNGSVSVATKYTHTIQEAKEALEDLSKAHAMGVITGEAYRKQWEQLITTIEGRLPEAYVVMREIDEPWEKFERRLEAINELFADGRISIGQYQRALEEVLPKLPEGPIRSQADNYLPTPGAAAGAGITTIDLTRAGNVAARDQAYSQYGTQAQQDLINYQDDLQNLQRLKIEAHLTDAETLQMQEQIRLKYVQVKTPIEELQDKLRDLRDERKSGLITEQEYVNEINTLYSTWEAKSTDAISGIDRALKEFAKQSHDTAGDFSKAFLDAFNGINDAIVNLVTKGELNFSQLVSTIEADLARMALHGLESSLISSIAGGIAGGAASAGGTPVADTVSSARTTTVVQIGNGGYGALLPALNTTAGRQQVAQIADVRSAVQKTLKAIRPGSR